MNTISTLRHEQLGLSRDQLIEALHGMMLCRAIDDRLWLLSRQGKAHFVITSAGHEATQFGCAWAINVGRDYVVPYYRDMALVLSRFCHSCPALICSRDAVPHDRRTAVAWRRASSR